MQFTIFYQRQHLDIDESCTDLKRCVSGKKVVQAMVCTTTYNFYLILAKNNHVTCSDLFSGHPK